MNESILTPGDGGLSAEFADPDRHSACVSNNRALIALLGVLAAGLLAMGLLAEPAQAAECADSLQAKINAAPSGGTVTANPCIYREQVSITKPLTLKGQLGSEIRGSDVWGPSEWNLSVSTGGTYYRSTQSLPQFYQEDVSCSPNTQDCAYPEQVFKDGVELEQIFSGDPTAGQFTVDADRKVVVATDPASAKFEVTVRSHWVTGGASADRVTIDNINMTHAANEWRSGAIQSRAGTTLKADGSCCAFGRQKPDGDDWNVLNSDLSYSHGGILSLRGPNSNTENNEIHHSGQLGMHNPGSGSLVKNNRIYRNNLQDYCYKANTDCAVYNTDTDARAAIQLSGNNDLTTVEAGGVKIAGGRSNITFDGNEVYENWGRAVWSDVYNTGITIKNNRIHHNARSGIFYEISSGGTITGNVIYENGWATTQGNGGACISNSNSKDVLIENNTCAWNADGIWLQSSNRDSPAEDAVTGNVVRNNRILQEVGADVNQLVSGMIQTASSNGTPRIESAAAGNQSAANKFWTVPQAEGTQKRFGCGPDRYTTLTVWLGSTCTSGTNDAYMTKAEKDTVIASKNIPANPEPH